MDSSSNDIGLGNPAIDDQHAQLLHCLDELRLASEEDRTLFAVYCLTRLKHHVRNHFALEEKLMRASGFPGLAHHVEEHESFRTRLISIQINSIHQDISREIVDSLSHWLIEHFRVTDGEYATFLRTSRKEP